MTETKPDHNPADDSETSKELSFEEADQHIRTQANLQVATKEKRSTNDFNRVQRNIWDHNRKPFGGTSRAFRSGYDGIDWGES